MPAGREQDRHALNIPYPGVYDLHSGSAICSEQPWVKVFEAEYILRWIQAHYLVGPTNAEDFGPGLDEPNGRITSC